MSDAAQAGTAGHPETHDLIGRIGQLTRALHDSMRELGLDKEVQKAAEAIPDARDRLSYIATTTEQAAERALSSIEVAQPLQEALESRADALSDRWDEWFAAPVALADARDLVADTRGYLRQVPEQARATSAELHKIMMAQDFQDLTGQVIKKLVEVIRRIEHQLVEVLLDNMADDRARTLLGDRHDREHRTSLVNGPQVRADAADIVTDQSQVDDLLDSLGF
ncbi:protein phosphatase CheZ [Salinisphaera sp. T31B1]|uniref:protein phosphatase CheZ n=1 Tax=Salinisphaera sp. T31B1 TaxID=727963 RepID=UPI00334216E8